MIFLSCLNKNKANDDVKYVNFGWNLRLRASFPFRQLNSGMFGSGVINDCFWVSSSLLKNSWRIRFSCFVYFFFWKLLGRKWKKFNLLFTSEHVVNSWLNECCWFSTLLRVLRFFPLLKNQQFLIPIRSGLSSSTLSWAPGSGDYASAPCVWR